jgi:pantoate--beta-alanine ligase
VQLSQTLKNMAAALQAGATDIAALEAHAMKSLTDRGWKPDYLVARRRVDLQPPQPNEGSGQSLVVLGAAKIGNTRLIDNIEV